MLDATNPPDHELAGTNPPDHDIHETSPAGHEGLAHYDGPATSTPPSPLELPSPAVNAAPVDDDVSSCMESDCCTHKLPPLLQLFSFTGHSTSTRAGHKR
ncbi:hypothetical protein EDD17DRAFT_1760903 [Pisolithus thermaeus]|nr:hypothetical protein EDD17DRAFT_1760903 [Pisolithus thermaeus]